MLMKLVVAFSCALGVLVWRFVFADLQQAKALVADVSYYLFAGALAAAAWGAWRILGGVSVRHSFGDWRRHLPLLAILGAGSVFLHLHEPHLFKVTQDETTHLAMSYTMHLEKSAQVPGQAHYVGDVYAPSGFYPSFRLGLFSFVASLVHDFTGYRVENIFVVNALLTPLLLWVTWGVGRQVGGYAAGFLAAVGMACSPLLAQVVTSGSYDVLNLVLLGGACWATLRYVKSEGQERPLWLNWSLALVVLLALSRYESIVYIVIWALCVGYVSLRDRRFTMTWFVALAPVLLLPNLAANYITMATQAEMYAAIKGASTPFFSAGYIRGNLEAAVYYLFTTGNRFTNNSVVALVGAVGLVFLFVNAAVGKKSEPQEGLRGFAAWALLIIAVYGIVLASFWSSPLDDAATRFILPLYWVLAISGGWMVARWSVIKDRPAIPLLSLVAGQVFMVAPVGGLAYSTYSLVGARADAWIVEQAGEYPRRETLFVSPTCSSLIANRFAVVPIEKLQETPARFVKALKADLYETVVVCQYLSLSAAGRYEVMPGSELPKTVKLKTATERVWAGQLMVRLSTFVGYTAPDGTWVDLTTSHPEVELKEGFRNANDAVRYRQSLYP